MALAQLPLLFLLSTKNSILAALLGRGYEKLNFLHRWSGRAVFLSATIHGSLWINNHIKLKASLKEEKEMRGIFAYTILCIMILTSLRPVRNLAYQFFFVSQ
jgi:heme O synthase-like polyprenyltransferase